MARPYEQRIKMASRGQEPDYRSWSWQSCSHSDYRIRSYFFMDRDQHGPRGFKPIGILRGDVKRLSFSAAGQFPDVNL